MSSNTLKQSGRSSRVPANCFHSCTVSSVLSCGLICIATIVTQVVVVADDKLQEEFFEARIRPVLIKHCYECHSTESDTVQGGLLIDSAAGVLRGGDSGPSLVPGKPDDSLLLSALKYDGLEMPPDSPLPTQVVSDFEQWISAGAIDPRTEEHPSEVMAEIDIEKGRQFWAYQSPKSADLIVQDYSARIDELVNRRLASEGLQANQRASDSVLLRRISFDLTGLPPTREQMSKLSQPDGSLDLETLVDELLDSPQYGERWARLWLDISRYAEDQAHIVGNNKSLFYPNAWMYRDWVIEAFNRDLPYDHFIRLQLAADMIPETDETDLAALGFIGLGPKYYRRGDPEVMADEWEDRVDVISRGLLGLTVACARCHDHKYDPIATEDYYSLAGVFAGTEMFNRPLKDDVEKDKNGQAKSPDKSMHIVRDGSPRDLAVMIRGDVNNTGAVVPRGFLQVLYPGSRREFHQGSGRLELAEAIVARDNPLTARVIVNRVWKEYFGRGLVPTTSNFGELGERPSHPELLDDLTVGFMDNDWSLKWLHRQIVSSQTYQRSSEILPQSDLVDPSNVWLWRMPRRRLSVEAWRDAVLRVSNQLDPEVGGKSVEISNPAETRRSIYSAVSRFQLDPLLALFDFPDPNVHASGRVETNTPLQKLFLLNSEFMTVHSQNIAAAIDTSRSTDHVTNELFQRILGRSAEMEEHETVANYIAEHPNDGWQRMSQILLASNEFWIVD